MSRIRLSLAFRLKGGTIVRVFYSDETGTGDDSEPICVVAGVLVNMDAQWHGVEQDLRALVPKGARKFEFKGAKLLRDLRSGQRRERADKTLKGICSTILKNRLSVFHSACHRQGLKNAPPKATRGVPKTPYEVAFLACLMDIEKYVHLEVPEERVLWISDKSRYDELLKKQFWGYQGFVQPMFDLIHALGKISGNPGAPEFTSVADTMYFGDSSESLGLQLADVCCSLIAGNIRGDSVAIKYYNMIRFNHQTDGRAVMFTPDEKVS